MDTYRINIEITDITNAQMQRIMEAIYDAFDAQGIDSTGVHSQVTDAGFELVTDEDATMANLDAIREADEEVAERYMTKATSITGLIIKAETEGLDTEEEFFTYIWTLVSSGLVNSTGSNQRLVSDFAYAHGEGWEVLAREAFKSYFNGAVSVQEVGL